MTRWNIPDNWGKYSPEMRKVLSLIQNLGFMTSLDSDDQMFVLDARLPDPAWAAYGWHTSSDPVELFNRVVEYMETGK